MTHVAETALHQIYTIQDTMHNLNKAVFYMVPESNTGFAGWGFYTAMQDTIKSPAFRQSHTRQKPNIKYHVDQSMLARTVKQGYGATIDPKVACIGFNTATANKSIMCMSLADRFIRRLITWHAKFFTATHGKTPEDMKELLFDKASSFMVRKSLLSNNQLVYSGKAGEGKDDTVMALAINHYIADQLSVTPDSSGGMQIPSRSIGHY